MRLALVFFCCFISFILRAQPKDLFYQTVNSENVGDSIQEYLMDNEIEFVKFSRPG